METATLKAFATSARTELIREVTARITAVLSQGSPERVESPTAVASLEKAVAVAGGGDKGKAHVADKVAYTWFNRIIALRFMDANGYTGIGVVSPAADQVGQPEVLAAAKRGQVDQEVVSSDRTTAAIAGLLNGTRQPRPGVDAQSEAYSLILVAYCQFWYKTMPFMFEREGDFTELLIPANLLANDSVLNRSVEVLTADVCQDVEVIGWLYQFYISDRHDEVFAGFKKNKKAGADEIPAATQLFTPHWIVRYLVENSVGRLWMLNRPTSGLVHQMDYYIAPVDEDADFLKIGRPEELKVIDPACGSGHMLTYAFDLLYAIYEEEGYAPSEIPRLILANNLYGTEIDPRAGALAAFALTMKAATKRKLFLKSSFEPNVCVLEPFSFGPDELEFLVTKDGDLHAEEKFWNQFAKADTFGALIQPDATLVPRLAQHLELLDKDGRDIFRADAIDRARRVVKQGEYLAQRYSVVVANPPYMGSANMGLRLAEMINVSYSATRQDLYACFVNRSRALLPRGGLLAIITGDSWVSLKTFKEFREDLLQGIQLHSLLHLEDVSKHADIFGANTAFVCSAGTPSLSPCTFIRLEPPRSHDKGARLVASVSNPAQPWVYRRTPCDFTLIPGTPIAYTLTDEDLHAFASGGRLGDIIAFKEGINTGENERFLRRWWEVSLQRTSINLPRPSRAEQKWLPLKKGGPFRKWAGNEEYVVDWSDDGAEIKASPRATPRNTQYFFLKSVSWGRISSGDFSMRYHGEGFGFDSTGPCGFANDQHLKFVIGYLNSNFAKRFLGAMSSTLDFRLGNMSSLPVPREIGEVDTAHVDELIAHAKRDWNLIENAWDFSGNPLVGETDGRIEDAWSAFQKKSDEQTLRVHQLEETNNRYIAEAFGLTHVDDVADLNRVSLNANPHFQFSHLKGVEDRVRAWKIDAIKNLISYSVGCMFGRYSLDEPGLILADQGATLQDYFTKVPSPTFMPDADNVIPIVDGDWFEDDVTGRFRQFLRVAFGDKHLEENLRSVTESLAVKNLREYFITKAGRSKFYDDHVQRYKKRPIYWLFSSPKGSFNALIYLHRYTPSTTSTVLTYLREYVTKLESSLQQAERAGNAKEADRLRKILVELNEYEHDTLYPKASENVVIDLDDGVKVNYPKLGGVLRKIVGLESSSD